jgi:HK97 family phage portal protein
MSLFAKLLRGGPFDNPQVPMTSANVNYFLDMFGGNRVESNEVVTPITAMQTATVFACVRILSEQVGKMPLNVFERSDAGKRLAMELPLFDLLELNPNPEMTAMTFRQTVTAQCLLWGNGYAEIQRNGAGQVIALWPHGAWNTKPVRVNGRLLYETTDGNGQIRYIRPEDMLHIPYVSLDGMIGLSPIAQARQAIGSSLAMDKFGARFFGNYAMPKIAIQTDKPMRPEDKTMARQDWEALQSGVNQHRVAILDNGMKIQQLSIPPEDAQFLQSRAFTKREICALYGVPPQMVGDLEKAIKSNVEQQGIEFLQYTLAPLLARWLQEVRRKLLPHGGKANKRYTVGFDVRELLRPDATSRQAYYQSGIQNGYLTPNEVREFEDMNPYEGEIGWEPVVNSTLQPLSNMVKQEPGAKAPAHDTEIADEAEQNI